MPPKHSRTLQAKPRPPKKNQHNASYIESLPNELLLNIIDNLGDTSDINHLHRTNHFFRALTTPSLHFHATKDQGNLTALQWAASNNYNSLVQLLLANPHLPQSPTANSKHAIKHPIFFAIYSTNPETVKLFIDHGSPINTFKYLGNTPIHYLISIIDTSSYNFTAHPNRARKANLLEILRLLLEHSPDLTSTNEQGMTALHLAAGSVTPPCPAAAEMLMERGAPVDALTMDGETPLHMASRVGSLRVVEALIKRGAELNVRNGVGKTPLGAAGYRAVESLLMKYGLKE